MNGSDARRLTVAALLAYLAGCVRSDATPPQSLRPDTASTPAASVVELAIQLPGDTLFSLGAPLRLTVTARDGAGQLVEGTPMWSVSDTTLARISTMGELRVMGTGTLTVAATLLGASAAATFSVVAADGDVTRDVLTDVFVQRVVQGIDGAAGDVMRERLAKATAALASGDAAVLRQRAIELRDAFEDAAATPDRALVGVLALYMERLERALHFQREEP